MENKQPQTDIPAKFADEPMLKELYLLNIGEYTKSGYEVIGKTSEGLGYIGIDKNWDISGDVIVGYNDFNGKPFYEGDPVKYQEIYNARKDHDAQWNKDHGVTTH